MKDLFESTVTIPNIAVNKDHVLPDTIDEPNAFSYCMIEEAKHPISYTIRTEASELYNTPIQL